MEQVVMSALLDDGMRMMKVIGDAEIAHPVRYYPRLPEDGRRLLQAIPARDELLGLHSLELTWPIFEAWEVACFGPKKFRRLMMVHYAYADKVSDVIELARVSFFCGTRRAPGYAFVKNAPAGAEDGMIVHGLMLFEADWMPGRCVAVGGA